MNEVQRKEWTEFVGYLSDSNDEGCDYLMDMWLSDMSGRGYDEND